MLLSSLIGGLLYVVTQHSIEKEAEERFSDYAKQAQGVISVRIKSYADLLRGAGSLLQSSPSISHRQFHEYVQGLELSKNFPAVHTLNFAMYVSEQGRPAFEKKLADELYEITGKAAQIKVKPAGIRPYYLPATFIEPPPPSAEYYGIDLIASPYLQTQVMRSRDEGTLRTSGIPIAALSSPNNVYIGLRLPVYQNGVQTETVEQRRKAYVGSIGIAFSVPRLVQGVLDEMRVREVRMRLLDPAPELDGNGHRVSSGPRTLYDSRGSASEPSPALETGDDMLVTTLPLDFNGRPWQTVYSVPRARLYSELDTYSPKLMMAFGFVASALLYALLYTLTTSRRAALKIAQEMTSELRESQHKLQQSHEKLRQLGDHAYQVKELERKRIAREIHDDLGQNLLALRIEAEMLATRTRSAHQRLHKRARATLLQIDVTIKSVRQIINDLRPTVLDLGLSAAVEWQVNEFQRRTGIDCELLADHQEIALTDHCATAFFRILQESLTNIIRHANATEVKIELSFRDGWLSLIVRDNGCGLPPGGRHKHGSFGLVGIEERVHILGGTCTVYGGPGGGTTVAVSVPVVEMPPPPARQSSEQSSALAVGPLVV
jgi:signal transduction histidine kinase